MAIIRSSRIYLLAITILFLCSFSGKENTEYKKLSVDQYNELVKDDKLVLVDFYAPWCRPCNLMSPHIDKVAEMYKGKIKVVRINVDENKTMSTVLNVKYLPTIYFYKNQKAVWNNVGYLDQYALRVYLNRYL